ncbi:MAG TPA: putative Ig domain-containing protein [Nitrospira sp.]|nr:putative Ig domain-containing protein [Nitrospira sp.]
MASPGNHPPVIRTVTIQPVPLTLTGPVSAHAEAQDVDRNPLRFRYQWTINGGAVAGQEGEQLPAALLKRGDRVTVRAWPHDGIVEGASMTSEQVVIANSPPVVAALEIDPPSVFPGMRVQVRANLSDVDGDTIHALYRWWRNGKVIHEGDDPEFETAGFVRGDTLVVEAVPSDGASTGAAIRSAAIPVGNTPPKIVSSPATAIVNNRYDYRVQATDAESDAITFSLEAAPPGMQIDAQTGVVTWAAASSQAGAHKVRILAKDSQGAVAFQEFELNLTAVAPAAPAGA